MLNDADLEYNWDDVVLLLPFNSNFIDVKNSLGPTALNGNVFINPNPFFVKNGTGSAAFNGLDAAIRMQHNELTEIGTSDFTIEFFMYPTRVGVEGGGAYTTKRGVFTNHTITPEDPLEHTLTLLLDDESLILNINGIGDSPTFDISTNFWTHVAISREGSNLRFFIDGEFVHVFEDADYNFSTNTFILGAANFLTDVSGFGYFAGYIDDFRYTLNFARYTEDFSPPIAAYPTGNTIRRPVNYFPHLRMVASEGIENISRNIEPINNRRFHPSVTLNVPFFDDTPSFYFNRNGITTFSNVGFRVGLNNFTFESWIYLPSANTTGTIFAGYGYPTLNNFLMTVAGGHIRIYGGRSSVRTNGTRVPQNMYTPSGDVPRLPVNKWVHVAWSREGSINRVFVDGKQTFTFNNRTNWVSTIWTVGHRGRAAISVRNVNLSTIYRDIYQEGDYFTGYMNYIEGSNLVCKYKEDFDPLAIYFSNRVINTTYFDPVQDVQTRNIVSEVLVRIEVDTLNNNNIFWFNNNAGFVLQKPASTLQGARISSATINSSGNLIVTLTNNTVFDIGSVLIEDSLKEEINEKTYLKAYNNGSYDFIEFVSGANVAVIESDLNMVITSPNEYSVGKSFNGSVEVSERYNEDTISRSNLITNSWLPIQLNTVANNTLSSFLDNDYRLTLAPGTYYFSGYSTFLFTDAAIRLIDITSGIIINEKYIHSTNDPSGSNVTSIADFNGTFTVYTESLIEFQLLAGSLSGGISTSVANSTIHKYTFFKVS